MLQIRILLTFFLVALASTGSSSALERDEASMRQVFYVRQTVGDDANDGLSPETAWQTLSKLAEKLQTGDTAFVGPGLYREMLTLANSGTAENPITIIADRTGEHTTDPPGVVMITGADTVDETIFVPEPTPGVYKAIGLDKLVMNVTEMDGTQYRYRRVSDATEHIREGLPQHEVVARNPSTMFYDRESGILYLHTSDGQPPATHEIELIRRNYGIVTYGKQYVTVIGFTFRHMGTAGLNFQEGSHHCVAIDNRSYGSWQGIRVFGSNHVVVADNEVFCNSNSGIYFALGSAHGIAVGNTLYKNAKGLRWSSNSVDGLALDNVAFANRETGIAIEQSDGVRVICNSLVDNGISHLFVRKSRYTSEANCFARKTNEGFIADLGPFTHHRTLADYRRATNQDLASREGCGRLPETIDVHRLHAETLAYADRAQKLLAERGAQPNNERKTDPPKQRWRQRPDGLPPP